MAPARRAELEREAVPFTAIANPRLTVRDGEQAEFFEGCLSLEGYRALVPRARRVRVDALGAHGEPLVIDARGWHARILQHEIDHLGGALYIDRADIRTLATNDHYARFWDGRRPPLAATGFLALRYSGSTMVGSVAARAGAGSRSRAPETRARCAGSGSCAGASARSSGGSAVDQPGRACVSRGRQHRRSTRAGSRPARDVPA
jgi:hypothetical protein